MYSLAKQRGDFKKRNTPNKVLSVLNKKKQSNPDVKYIITPHTRGQMKERHLSERDIVKSIEEFDKTYENDDRTIVEKNMGDHIIRTIYSFNMYTKEIYIISSMHINKKKFATKRTDSFSY